MMIIVLKPQATQADVDHIMEKIRERGLSPHLSTGQERRVIGVIGDERTINPYTYVTGFPGWNLLMFQYDTLLQLDVAGLPQPWLASAYDVSDDGLTYTVQLEPNVTWNDGQPLTAADVVFTVDYFKANLQSRFTGNLKSVTAAKATGDQPLALKNASMKRSPCHCQMRRCASSSRFASGLVEKKWMLPTSIQAISSY